MLDLPLGVKKHKSAPLMENPEPKAGDPLDGELPTHGQAS